MAAVNCKVCLSQKASIKRPKTGDALCRECFFTAFETEVHYTITTNNLFSRGDKVAIAASGGKDSTVLAYVMNILNQRYNYGLDLFLLSIDEGITGYRDDSLESVRRNRDQLSLPLKVISYKELYGWTMDAIVRQIGLRNNCTFCGVFRRQALDRGALLLSVDKIVTGHNADDIAETVLMNILRGDIARLQRCTSIVTGSEGAISRSKPFKFTYEKEIVMYACFKRLDYFSTECIYSPNAYRGHARTYLKDLESIRPSSIIDIIHSGDSLSVKTAVKLPVQGTCSRCGYIASQDLCKACVLLEGLNKGLPRLGIGKATGQNLAEYVRKLQSKESAKGKVIEKSKSDGAYAEDNGLENRKETLCQDDISIENEISDKLTIAEESTISLHNNKQHINNSHNYQSSTPNNNTSSSDGNNDCTNKGEPLVSTNNSCDGKQQQFNDCLCKQNQEEGVEGVEGEQPGDIPSLDELF